MKKFSKSIITVLVGALVAAAGSCSTSPSKAPLVVDGEDIRAGVFILQQQVALNDAVSKLMEEQPDLDTSAEGFSYLNQTVEGVKFADWVYNRTVEKCRNYIAVNRLFDTYGLTIPAETMSEITANVNSLWTEENQYAQYFYGVDVVGEYFEKIGVGQESYRDVQINTEKQEELFDYLYSADGPMAVSQDVIDEKLTSDYVAINYFAYNLEHGEGAQAYADRIINGETFEEVYKDYMEKEFREVDADRIAEAEANGEDTTDYKTVILPETDSLIHVKSRTDDYPSAEMIAAVFDEMQNGEIKVIEVTDNEEDPIFIVQKFDITTKPAATEEYVDDIIHDLKETDFDDLLKTTGEAYSVAEGSTAKDYKVERLF